jgi:phosphate transport system substrate-binding protein
MSVTRRKCLVALGTGFAAGSRATPSAGRTPAVLSIFGDETLHGVLLPLNAFFESGHAGIRVEMTLRPPPAGIDGIVAGVSMLAPLGHDATEGELEPFKRLFGYLPIDVRIGRVGHAAPGAVHPPAVYVHADNPLASLSLQDLARVLTTGQPDGDLRRWRQLGLDGDRWKSHAIHLYGPRDNGGELTGLRATRFGNKPLAMHYEAFERDDDVVEAVRADRYGLGIVSHGVDAALLSGARVLPLASGAGAGSIASLEDVRQGRYPLSPFVHAYLPARSRAEIDPLTRDYLRLALSAPGQQLLRALESSPSALVPLRADELAIEQAKVG